MEVDLRPVFSHHACSVPTIITRPLSRGDASGRVNSEQLQQLTLHAAVKCRTPATTLQFDTLVQQAVSSPEFQSGAGWDFETFDVWYTDFHWTHATCGENMVTLLCYFREGPSC